VTTRFRLPRPYRWPRRPLHGEALPAAALPDPLAPSRLPLEADRPSRHYTRRRLRDRRPDVLSADVTDPRARPSRSGRTRPQAATRPVQGGHLIGGARPSVTGFCATMRRPRNRLQMSAESRGNWQCGFSGPPRPANGFHVRTVTRFLSGRTRPPATPERRLWSAAGGLKGNAQRSLRPVVGIRLVLGLRFKGRALDRRDLVL
jgi:hypothetical protein